MPTFTFEGAIFLLAVAIVDVLVLTIDSVKQQGTIKLPDSSEDQFTKEKDPFDVTSPFDYEDGVAINEKLFWTRVNCLFDLE
jgi:hypothetical protein